MTTFTAMIAAMNTAVMAAPTRADLWNVPFTHEENDWCFIAASRQLYRRRS